MRIGSWVIVRKGTLESVTEIFNPTLVAKINTEKYEALPALEYLQAINRQIASTDVGKRNREKQAANCLRSNDGVPIALAA
jgi:hypothetical protein